MDVDGTLTDGKIYLAESGELMKAFNVKDGYGIKEILPKYDVIPAIITGRTSEILNKRCRELAINYCYQDVKDKEIFLIKLLDKQRLKSDEVAYIGDDDNDLLAMGMCGVRGCPADASMGIKCISNFISSKDGGKGAVREFIEWMAGNEYIK